MTVIEVSLRQIYHIESNIAEKGDVFGDLNELTIDIQMIKVVEEFDELTSRIIDAMALHLHSSRDRAQNANFLQRPRNLTHFVPPKSRPPPFSFR